MALQQPVKIFLFSIFVLLTALAFSDVALSADGSGTATVSPASLTVGSTGNTLTFVYTAAENMPIGAAFSFTMPAGWSAPQGTSGVAGYTAFVTSSQAGFKATDITLSFSGQTVTVTLGAAVSASKNVQIAYGSGGGASGATAQTAAGTATFIVKSKVSAGGTLTDIANHPTTTVNPGPIADANSSISASPTTLIADDTALSTITVIIKDQFNNPITGKNISISSTGTGDTITQPAAPTDANGQATATIKSTKAETKTISATNTADVPNVTLGKTVAVTFTSGPVSATASTITSSASTLSVDNTAGATIVVTLKDQFGNPVSGKNVSISSTGSDNTITQPAVPTNASGQVTANIKSTKPEAKTISATNTTDNITLTNTVVVTFTVGAMSTSLSTVVASPSSLSVDNTAGSTITITLLDQFSNPISGKTATISSTGSGNIITPPAAATNASGQTTAVIKSTKAEAKTISATNTTDNIALTNKATATFTIGAMSPSVSTISAFPTTVSVDSASGSTITITLLDQFSNPISGKTATISSTGSGNTITQPAAATNASGQTTAVIKSTKAEAKTISATNTTDNIALTNTATATFTVGAVSSGTSTVSASPTTLVANNVDLSTITATLKDQFGNPVSGKNVSVSSTGTGNTIAQSTTPTNASGQITATIKSTKAETKTISATDTTDVPNVVVANTATATFTAGSASASVSTISASPTSISVDTTSGVAVTVTIKDSFGNPISGKSVTVSATGTGNTITQPSAPTDANGQATATLNSTKPESKTISATNVTDNIALTNTATATFTIGAVSASVSTISASPTTLVADNVATSTITVTLKDQFGNLVSGKNVSVSSSGSGNTIAQPTKATDANGVATATIKSTVAEAKTVSAANTSDAINLTNSATVTFTAGPVSASVSTISASPTNLPANGIDVSTVTITLKDQFGNPVSGKNATISATGSGNTITQPVAATNASGQTTATIKSTVAASKTLSATNTTDNIALTNTAIVTFFGDVSATVSTVSVSPTSISVDNASGATITVTLKDQAGNPVSGKNVSVSATGSGNTITAPTTPTDANGQYTAIIKSTKAESKTISATDTTDSIAIANTATATFTIGAVSATASTIVANPSAVVADNVSEATITVTLKDQFGNPVPGKSVTVSATGLNNTITQSKTTPTDANGQFTATIKSSKAEEKTISAINTTDNVALANVATATFVAGTMSATASTITVAPASLSVDDQNGTTATIALKDSFSNPISGKSVLVSSTGTGNTITQPATPTDVNGQTTAVIKSTKAEAKTISATNTTDNLSLSGTATATFTIGAVSGSASTISASPAAISVDNASGSTITVTLTDQFGNPISEKSITVSATGSGNTITQPKFATDVSGKATATIKSTKSEIKTVSALDTTDNIALTQTATLEFTVGAVSDSVSTISVSPTAIPTDEPGGATITVILKDQYGNLVSGKSVAVSATGTGNTIIQPASPTDANGQVTANITSTKAETKTILATDTTDNVSLSNTASITFTGAFSPSLSALSVSPTTLSVTSATGSTITVTLKDAIGSPIPGRQVVISATGSNNTITQPGLTNANGQATAIITSTKAEVKTISATETRSNTALNQTPTVTFTPGPVSNVVSTIFVSLATLTVEAAAGVTITVTINDQFGNPISGRSVTVSASGTNNTITQPTALTNASGQTTANIKSTKAETKTISAVDNTVATSPIALVNTATTTFTAGVVSATTISTISASPSSISVDDVVGTTILVTLKDQFGNPVAGKEVSISATGSKNVITQPAAPSDVDGGVTANLKSTKAEEKIISATDITDVPNITLTSTASILIFTTGVISVVASTISVSPATLSVDSATGTTITVTINDQFDNPISGVNIQVSVSGTDNTITQPSTPTDVNGKVAANLKSTKAEVKTISAREPANNITLISTVNVTFTPGAMSTALSTLSTSQPAVSVEDLIGAAITVSLKDQFSNPIPGKNVEIASTGVNNVITQSLAPTDAKGQATATIKSTTAEVKTISATNVTDNLALTNIVSVRFINIFSTLTSTSHVLLANGVATATVKVFVRDVSGNLFVGNTVSLNAAEGGVSIIPASATTDATGSASFSLSSTVKGLKTINAVLSNPDPLHLLETIGVAFVSPIATPLPSRIPQTAEAISFNGALFASGSDTGQVELWDVVSKSKIATLSGHTAKVNALAFNPSGSRLASASADNSIIIWDVNSKTSLFTFSGILGLVHALTFSPDGKFLTSVATDVGLMMWDVLGNKLIKLADTQLSTAYVAYNPTNAPPEVATVSGSEVNFWNVKDNRLEFSGKLPYLAPLGAISYSVDGKLLIAGSDDRKIIILDPTQKRLVGSLSGHTAKINAVAVASDAKFLASASDDKSVILWNLTNRTKVSTLTNEANVAIHTLRFTPDVTKLIGAGSSIFVWDISFKTSDAEISGHVAAVRSVDYNSDGSLLVSGSADRKMILWNANSKAQIASFTGHTDIVNSVKFSPSGTLLLSGSKDRSLILWNVGTRSLNRKFLGHTGSVSSVAFSPDLNTAASGSEDSSVRLWNLSTGDQVGSLTGSSSAVNSVDYSPDGKLLAAGSANATVLIWDVATKTLIASLKGHGSSVSSVGFSPDGKLLASGSSDLSVIIWDVSTKTQKSRLVGHAKSVKGVEFSIDGRLLASAAADATIILWDVNNAQLASTFISGTAGFNSVDFNPDGMSMAAGTDDALIHFWNSSVSNIPTLTAPANNATLTDAVKVSFEWGSSSKSILYQIQLSKDNAFAPTSMLEDIITGFTRIDIPLKSNVVFWRVRQVGFSGSNALAGGWSEVRTFTSAVPTLRAEVRSIVSSEVTVDVIISSAHNLFAYQFDMVFDPKILSAVNATEGLFLKSIGGNSFFRAPAIDNIRGTISGVAASRTTTGEVSGNGTLATILFRGETFGVSKLSFKNVKISSETKAEIPALVSDGVVDFVVSTQVAANVSLSASNVLLNVEITNANNLHNHQFDIKFDQSAFDVVDVVEGDFLKAGGVKTSFSQKTKSAEGVIEQITNRRSDSTGVSNTFPAGILATITFRIWKGGSYNFQLLNHQFLDPSNLALGVKIVDESITVVASPEWDVDKNYAVDIFDLVLLASSFGQTISGEPRPNPDVDRNKVVDIIDLVIVATNFGKTYSPAPASPPLSDLNWRGQDYSQFLPLLLELYKRVSESPKSGQEYLKAKALLEELITLAGGRIAPDETLVKQNYPNPFNPETWIPYQLSEDADVNIDIFEVSGRLIRRLSLGKKPAGFYLNRDKAAHWDGRNNLGERVSSGVYFYAITAGKYRSVKKMAVVK